MKKCNQKIILIIAVLSLIGISGNMIKNPNKMHSDANEIQTNKENESLIPNSAISHAPIFIDGDDPANDWDDCDAVTGNGTSIDPYVIKDLNIVAGHSTNGITLSNSNDFVIIRNCSIYNSSLSYGIEIKYSSNIRIENCSLFNNFRGISLFHSSYISINNSIYINQTSSIKSEYGNHVEIWENTISETSTGVLLYSSNNNFNIFNNTFKNCNTGINMYGSVSYNLSVVHNILYNSGLHPIQVDDCINGNISNNKIEKMSERIINRGMGIYITDASNFTVEFNEIKDGIGASGMVLRGNNITCNMNHMSNLTTGIEIFNSMNCSLNFNTLNATYPIKSYMNSDFDYLTITNNIMYGNGLNKLPFDVNGVIVFENNSLNSKEVRFLNLNVNQNILAENMSQIIMAKCSNITVQKYNAVDVTPGISLYDCTNITFVNCSLETDATGILLEESSSIIFDSLRIEGGSRGISGDFNLDIIIRNSVFTNITYSVFDFSDSENITLYNNTFNTCGLSFYGFTILDMDDSNFVNGLPILFFNYQTNIFLDDHIENFSYLLIKDCQQILMQDIHFIEDASEIRIWNSHDIILVNNSIFNDVVLVIDNCDNITVQDNFLNISNYIFQNCDSVVMCNNLLTYNWGSGFISCNFGMIYNNTFDNSAELIIQSCSTFELTRNLFIKSRYEPTIIIYSSNGVMISENIFQEILNPIEIYDNCLNTLIYHNFPGNIDQDGDGLSNLEEFYLQTDPTVADTDFDGLNDYEEVVDFQTNPLLIDTDKDNFLDGYEIHYGTDPNNASSYPNMPEIWFLTITQYYEGNMSMIETTYAIATQNIAYLTALNGHLEGNVTEIREILDELGFTIGDTDYDGLDDLDEVLYNTSLTCSDTDCDNLNDAFEIKVGTNPLNDDSDNDTWYDGVEVAAGTNPLDANDYPNSDYPLDDNTTDDEIPSDTNPQNIPIELMIGGIGGSLALIGIISIVVIKRRKNRL